MHLAFDWCCNWIKNFAPLNVRDLHFGAGGEVLPETSDFEFKCHKDHQEHAGC